MGKTMTKLPIFFFFFKSSHWWDDLLFVFSLRLLQTCSSPLPPSSPASSSPSPSMPFHLRPLKVMSPFLSLAFPVGRICIPLSFVIVFTNIGLELTSLQLLQQHINRGQRRWAHMSGRAELSVDQMAHNLYKRLLAVEGPEGLRKRYNRFGLPKAAKAGESFLASGNALPHSGRCLMVTGSFSRFHLGPPPSQEKSECWCHCKLHRKRRRYYRWCRVSLNLLHVQRPSCRRPIPTVHKMASLSRTHLQLPILLDSKLSTSTISRILLVPIIISSLYRANDVGYLATVQMGTPPRNFLILMDSGSADLWVGAENCQSQTGGGCVRISPSPFFTPI